MAKLLSKKSEREPSRPLNEREIQERLYGRYHRDTVLVSPDVNIKPPLPQAEPKVKRLNTLNTSSFAQSFKTVFTTCRGLVSSFVRKFPWKFAAWVTVSLVVVIISFQFVSLWFAKIKSIPKAPKVSVQNEPVVPVAVKVDQVKTVSAPPAPVSISVSQGQSSQSNAPTAYKKKFYAVQVCTYEREEDARQLTSELQKLNFPAFYRQFLSSHQRIPHYVVFLSQEDTFAEANAKLNEFRKTRHFLTFSDSFIRSL